MRHRTFVLILIVAVLVAMLNVRAARSLQDQAADMSRIQKKVEQVQEQAPRWVQAGGDPRKIQPLAEQLERHLQAGEFTEVEATADKILAIVGAGPSTTSERRLIGQPKKLRLNKIPASAEIVYLRDNLIYTMDRNGKNVTQITFEQPREYEHVAVSYDRRYVVANDQLPNPSGDPGGHSRLWLFDLDRGTEAQLLPEFITAGNGGVAWDQDGFIYFSAKEKDVYAQPKTPAQFVANAAANDIYRVKFDGAALRRITNTPTLGEADVSVSHDGKLVAAAALILEPRNDEHQIIVVNADGTNLRVVYKGGRVVGNKPTVADPEIAPDNKSVVFSKVNQDVPPNFPKNPAANTAHDLWMVRLDGGGSPVRLTRPGPISIIPNWQLPGDLIVYTEMNEKDHYLGAAIVSGSGGANQKPLRIKQGAREPKWIPAPR